MSPTQSTCRLFILCFSAFLIGKVVAKPDGAPVAACFDMTPQHFDPPQETDCPFVIKPAKVIIVMLIFVSLQLVKNV